MPTLPLRRVVIAYEPEAACRARLEAAGFGPDIAAEIACYLAQATDLAAIRPELTATLAEAGLEAEFVELDGLIGALPGLVARRDDTILWCQTDGIAYYRGSAVSALARLAGIPTYGSPPQAQHLCQDKFKCTALAAAAGLPVPPTALAEGRRVIAGAAVLDGPGPFFVKPNTLGAKIGIFADSRTADAATALEVAARLWERYRDRAVIQPFLPGHDIRVSYMDVGRPAGGVAGHRPARQGSGQRDRRGLHDHARQCQPVGQPRHRGRPDRLRRRAAARLHPAAVGSARRGRPGGGPDRRGGGGPGAPPGRDLRPARLFLGRPPRRRGRRASGSWSSRPARR